VPGSYRPLLVPANSGSGDPDTRSDTIAADSEPHTAATEAPRYSGPAEVHPKQAGSKTTIRAQRHVPVIPAL
jgi:hypothetical protein